MDGQGPSQMAEVPGNLSGPSVGRQLEKTTAAQTDLCSASPRLFQSSSWGTPNPGRMGITFSKTLR